MRRVFLLILSFFAVVMSGALPASLAWAQQNMATDSGLYANAHRATPVYEHMARTILRKFPQRFDFMHFRSLYAQTRQYDPIGEETLERMDRLSYTAANETDPEKSGLALLEYQALVADHLAHIGVVMRAAALAREDRRFGNPDFFQWVRAGLMQSVTVSGNGRSLRDAYDVITLTEETMLLQSLGYKLKQTLPRHEGFVFYNMNEVENLQSGEKLTIFVNTTYPMRFLEGKEKEKAALQFDIRRQ